MAGCTSRVLLIRKKVLGMGITGKEMWLIRISRKRTSSNGNRTKYVSEV